jgi:uncharacterized Zn-finger protein
VKNHTLANTAGHSFQQVETAMIMREDISNLSKCSKIKFTSMFLSNFLILISVFYRSYSCEDCGKKFYRKCVLINHLEKCPSRILKAHGMINLGSKFMQKENNESNSQEFGLPQAGIFKSGGAP